MRKNSHGRIISIGSLDYLGWQGKANYSAARSAIFGFTRSLALELAKSGITVNYVAKGEIAAAPLSEEDTARIKEVVPVQRAGKPEDVASVVGFFASDASSYLTGQTLFVCGGKSIYFSMSV
jgi:3-oxoacyl-[acyl-carrier protein] reductase/2-[hydroxy(phenyl)methyl]-succinyl-CoA dehydrogenase BbsC subunit